MKWQRKYEGWRNRFLLPQTADGDNNKNENGDELSQKKQTSMYGRKIGRK